MLRTTPTPDNVYAMLQTFSRISGDVQGYAYTAGYYESMLYRLIQMLPESVQKVELIELRHAIQDLRNQ